MRALIVEDEAAAARILQRMLVSSTVDVQVVGVVSSVRQAVSWLRSNPAPDLIFMDIELGKSVHITLTMVPISMVEFLYVLTIQIRDGIIVLNMISFIHQDHMNLGV